MLSEPRHRGRVAAVDRFGLTDAVFKLRFRPHSRGASPMAFNLLAPDEDLEIARVSEVDRGGEKVALLMRSLPTAAM